MARKPIGLVIALLAVGTWGCHAVEDVRSAPAVGGDLHGPQAESLFGEPLFRPALGDEVRAERERNLAAARAEGLDSLIWYGRRLAYLGRYRDAAVVYSHGMSLFPDEPELYRHRGHRHITLRGFRAARRDLETAARLMADRPDAVEQDGLPNAKNIPLGTLHFNVWYHLGLARYLLDDLEAAEDAYRRCLAVSANPDTVCATSHWLYMTLRRLGKDAEAARILESIDADMEIIENFGYHHLLLMYKGLKAPEELLVEGEDDIANATVAYGVANWHCYNGRRALGVATLRRVLKGSQWAAFGYIAAEADLKRMGEHLR